MQEADDLAPSLPVLPVCLLVAGRDCLVVGGGKVAARKVEHLLAAGARVTVVALRIGLGLAALVADETLAYAERSFRVEDVDDRTLVFAATDDGAVNRAVLAACRARGIWCNLADRHWTDGDLVTPAVLRRGDLTVAISTGGRSCRRSRLVKENLERHLAVTESADLVVLGTDHRLLDQRRREALHPDAAGLTRLGVLVQQIWGVHEFLILATCNRIEVWAVVGAEPATLDLVERIFGFDHFAPHERQRLRGFAAFAHATEVVAGLASQTPGEDHVRSQVRQALETARCAGWAGGMLGEWIAVALQTAKAAGSVARLPTEGIEDRCVAWLTTRLTAPAQVVVLGGGIIGRAVLERLPPGLRGRLAGRGLGADDLAGIDALVCATDEAGCVGTDLVAALPDIALVVDLGMPRNVAIPAVAVLGERLVDLDGLHAWAGSGAETRDALVGARAAIAAQRSAFDALMCRFQGGNRDPAASETPSSHPSETRPTGP